MCSDFSTAGMGVMLVNNGITILIIVINIIITNVTISQVEKIKFVTQSMKFRQMSLYVFLATFFNTAFVI